MSTFVNPAQTPGIGLSEEQAQLIDIAAGFWCEKMPGGGGGPPGGEETGF